MNFPFSAKLTFPVSSILGQNHQVLSSNFGAKIQILLKVKSTSKWFFILFSKMDGQQYCLKWNHHQSNLLKVFSRLLGNEQFTDVLLATESKSIRCHKVVLSACSSYFEHLFLTFDEKNQIIILKDTSYDDILALVEFMYRGEINVGQVSYNKLIAWIFFFLIFQNSYLKEKYWNFGVQIHVFLIL